MIRDNLIEVLHEMEEVTKLFKLEPFDIYIIGGGACILGEYTNRATLDIDFVDLGYPAKYGKVQQHQRNAPWRYNEPQPEKHTVGRTGS